MIKKLVASGVLFSLALTGLENPAMAQRNRKKDREAKEVVVKPYDLDTLIRPVPINRQLFTDHVQNALRGSDAKDGHIDGKIHVDDSATSAMLTEVILKRVPILDIQIENLEKADHQTKIKYHKALEKMVRRFNNKSFYSGDLSYFRKSVKNFRDLMIALEEGTIKSFIKNNANIYTLENAELLDDYPEEKAYVFETIGKAHPEMMIKKLPSFARESYADPIVAAAAKVVPGTILTYATSTSYLSTAVRRNKDPFVQSIVRIASQSRNPLRALPFLGPIHNGTFTIAEVDAMSANDVTYFKGLVALKISGDTLGAKMVEKELDYRALKIVRVVNDLHEEPAKIRFRSLLDYNAEELYYLTIGSIDEIYTSTFTWMFARLLEKMAPETGDAFLDRLHKNRFRTWIRMCAGYNTLADFLATMAPGSKTVLMKEFVAGLEKGSDEDLTDAVDVANAFGSIKEPELQEFLKKEVIANYEKNKDNKKGLIVYGLLSTIMNSAENPDALSGQLSIIPPITYVPREVMADETGTVIVQVFFYGDEDGMMSFNSFKSNFPSAKWTLEASPKWVTYTSKGKYPIRVYANRPIKEPGDIEAQEELAAYFEDNDIHPTMVIHRGHSYHLEGSLVNLTPDVKVVMLGSCGGYHNLSQVLDKAPDANIISSKQIGAARINEPIIKEMFKQLNAGEDINWIQSWASLEGYFATQGPSERDLFSDYIPPNENLGAIFIKAYRKMLQQVD